MIIIYSIYFYDHYVPVVIKCIEISIGLNYLFQITNKIIILTTQKKNKNKYIYIL